MLSKAIATSFNCPFVTIPGSGFAQTFIGMDAVIVRYLARKAKKLAAKWGGQCIVFIDEIDAVGMRRASLGSGFQPLETSTIHDHALLRPSGRADRGRRPRAGDRGVARAALRAARRADARTSTRRSSTSVAGAIRNFIMPGGGMGGGLAALNQLLVVMDGIDEPPLRKRFLTRKFNTFLDALYIVPQRIFGKRLRLKPPKPRKERSTSSAPATCRCETSTRRSPARAGMGRHIYFRTPTWEDRRDIFDLYLGKVAHEDGSTRRRRATSSPASPTATRRR